jgi:hypothetical protein
VGIITECLANTLDTLRYRTITDMDFSPHSFAQFFLFHHFPGMFRQITQHLDEVF